MTNHEQIKQELAEHFIRCYETGALVDITFVEKQFDTLLIAKLDEVEKGLNESEIYSLKYPDSFGMIGKTHELVRLSDALKVVQAVRKSK